MTKGSNWTTTHITLMDTERKNVMLNTVHSFKIRTTLTIESKTQSERNFQLMFCTGISYGRHWKNGDVVGCYIDLEKGTISFSLNGDDLGIAFENINSQHRNEFLILYFIVFISFGFVEILIKLFFFNSLLSRTSSLTRSQSTSELWSRAFQVLYILVHSSVRTTQTFTYIIINKYSLVISFVDCRYNPSTYHSIFPFFCHFDSPLQIAACWGQIECAQLLLEHAPRLNELNWQGST
jgi:hypothetical protein